MDPALRIHRGAPSIQRVGKSVGRSVRNVFEGTLPFEEMARSLNNVEVQNNRPRVTDAAITDRTTPAIHSERPERPDSSTIGHLPTRFRLSPEIGPRWMAHQLARPMRYPSTPYTNAIIVAI